MNYITLINHFWFLNRERTFTVNESMVYFGLLDTCNELRWKNPFKQNNGRFCAKIGISEASLLRAKIALQELGLIDFSSETGRNGFVLYTIKYPHKRGISEGIYEGINEGISEGINEGIYNTNLAFPKHKHRDKLNQTNSFLSNEEKSFDKNPKKEEAENFEFERKKGKERKKDCAQKKKDDFSVRGHPIDTVQELRKSNVIPYRQELINSWFAFNQKEFGAKPLFGEVQGSIFNRILRGLRGRLFEKGEEWTIDTAKSLFEAFLAKAFADDWLQKHFSLSNLEQQFDSILNNETFASTGAAIAKNSFTTSAASKTGGRGGTIAEMQSLKRGGTSNTV